MSFLYLFAHLHVWCYRSDDLFFIFWGDDRRIISLYRIFQFPPVYDNMVLYFNKYTSIIVETNYRDEEIIGDTWKNLHQGFYMPLILQYGVV